MKKRKIKFVFFDRDGIVNESPGPGRYVTRWEDFRLIPEFPLCLRAAQAAGYRAAIVTNQRCVALGLMTARDLAGIHRRLRRVLKSRYGLGLLAIASCPHDTNSCACRKPKPGMILRLARKHAIDLKRSWMIGDSDTDVEAGRRAGCRTVLVAPGAGASRPDVRVPGMAALLKIIGRMLA